MIAIEAKAGAKAKKTRKELFEQPSRLTGLINSPLFTNALGDLDIEYRDRIFSPLWTLWIFLTQVYESDSSCKEALAKFQAVRQQLGKKPSSLNTGGYCRARERLTEELLSYLLRGSATELREAQRREWLWRGRHVTLVDGTITTLADTAENQAEYRSSTIRPVNLPQARIVAAISLSSGAIEDFRISKTIGPRTGEPSILLQMWSGFHAEDVLLFDKNFSNFQIMTKCLESGVDFVGRLKEGRANSSRHERRSIGRGEWIITLHRAKSAEGYIDAEHFSKLPLTIELRLIEIKVKYPGFRAKTIYLVTSLLDQKKYPKEEIAALYALRWEAELDFRCLKTVLQMDTVRGKTPEMARKEILVHLLGYNLIRTVMAQAAEKEGAKARDLSFKAALQLFEAFRPFLSTMSDGLWRQGYQSLLELIGAQVIKKRPGRIEPRAVKRRKRKYSLLTIPRSNAKKMFWKKGSYLKYRKSHALK